MGLKENLDWGEKAVAEVKSLLAYKSPNQRGDLVATYMQEWEAWKAQAMEQAKANAAGPSIDPGARVQDKVKFFTQAASVPADPAPIQRGNKLNVFKLPSSLRDALIRQRYSTFQAAAAFWLNQGQQRNFHTNMLAMRTAAIYDQAGNCGELAAMAFLYLEENRVLPLDYMTFGAPPPAYDHCWVVIGRANGSQERDPSTWGEDAVWCDPWQMREGRAYGVQDLIKNKVTNLDAAYNLSSAELVQGGLPRSLWRSA